MTTVIQQSFTSMHQTLRQDVEVHYTGEEDINTVIVMAERIDSIYRSRGAYGKTPPNNSNTTKKPESKLKQQFKIISKHNLAKEGKRGSASLAVVNDI